MGIEEDLENICKAQLVGLNPDKPRCLYFPEWYYKRYEEEITEFAESVCAEVYIIPAEFRCDREVD